MRLVISLLALGSGLFVAAAAASFTFTVVTKDRVISDSGSSSGKTSQVRYASVLGACDVAPESQHCAGPWDTSFGPRP